MWKVPYNFRPAQWRESRPRAASADDLTYCISRSGCCIPMLAEDHADGSGLLCSAGWSGAPMPLGYTGIELEL